jgi:GxxExxY protein
MEHEDITDIVIGCAMKVHSALGSGLLESAYEICLVHELKKMKLMCYPRSHFQFFMMESNLM